MIYLANHLKELYDTPYLTVSFLGLEDTSDSLRRIARTFNDIEVMRRTEELIKEETAAVLKRFTTPEKIQGKKAAVNVAVD
jgi:nitrogenase molybdenum-cofactor synthesis protein NifE